MSKLTNQLLQRAGRVAVKMGQVQHELTKAFNERYGTTYSDVDADEIIDALDYGHGFVPSLKQCDAIMTEAGYPPIKNA